MKKMMKGLLLAVTLCFVALFFIGCNEKASKEGSPADNRITTESNEVKTYVEPK